MRRKKKPDHLPTTHLPGSEAKLRIMRQRLRAGLPLFHPLDAKVPDRVPQDLVVEYVNTSSDRESFKEENYRNFMTSWDERIHDADYKS